MSTEAQEQEPTQELQQDQPTEEQDPAVQEAADQADFEAGFDGEDPGQEPESPAEEPEPEEPQAAQEPAPAEPPTEPSQLDQLAERLRKAEGNIGGLKSHIQELSKPQQGHAAASQAAEAQGADAPTQEQFAAALKSGEKMAALREEFSEWSGALDEWSDTMAARLAQVEAKASSVDVGGLKQELVQENQSELAKLREIVRVDAAYPGWEETVQTDEFGAWLQVQNPELIAKTRSPKASDTLAVLAAFEKAKEPAPQTTTTTSNKQRRLEAAVTPTGAGGGDLPTARSEEQEFLDAFNSS